MGLKKDSCYYEEDVFGKYKVKLKMDRMKSNLKNQIKNGSYKSKIFWKLDTLFQIAIAIKKLHDKNVLHLDIKE